MILIVLALTAIRAQAAEGVPQWSVRELAFTASGSYANPYTEVALRAVFAGLGDVKQTVKGFWDGDNQSKVRFTPTIAGAWSYVTASNDAGLDGKRGGLNCTAAAKGSKGFLRRDAATKTATG